MDHFRTLLGELGTFSNGFGAFNRHFLLKPVRNGPNLGGYVTNLFEVGPIREQNEWDMGNCEVFGVDLGQNGGKQWTLRT